MYTHKNTCSCAKQIILYVILCKHRRMDCWATLVYYRVMYYILKPIKCVNSFNDWKYLILASVHTHPTKGDCLLNSLYLIGNVNCPLCQEIRETFQRPRQQAHFITARQDASPSGAFNAQQWRVQSRYFAGSVCGRDGNARVNSRRVPLMCQEQTFPESSIYAGTPGMQMKRVVLRRSLPRRDTITA